MSKINFDINEIIEANNALNKEMKVADFKFNLRKKGIVPVLRDNKLFVYKVSGTKKLSELGDEYRINMFDTYNKVILYDDYFKKFLKPGYLHHLSGFENMISFKFSTTDELWDYFDLNNEQNMQKFIENYLKEIKDETYTDNSETGKHRIEAIREIVEKIAGNYVTCTFKRNSKIAALIDLIVTSNYIDLDFLAALACEFLYSKDVDFSTGTTVIDEREKVDRMIFTKKEKSLSDDDKKELIKNILNGLDIECVYCDEIDQISDYLIESIFEIKARETVIEFAKHNAEILDDSDFATVYKNAFSSKCKTLKNQPN